MGVFVCLHLFMHKPKTSAHSTITNAFILVHILGYSTSESNRIGSERIKLKLTNTNHYQFIEMKWFKHILRLSFTTFNPI